MIIYPQFRLTLNLPEISMDIHFKVEKIAKLRYLSSQSALTVTQDKALHVNILWTKVEVNLHSCSEAVPTCKSPICFTPG